MKHMTIKTAVNTIISPICDSWAGKLTEAQLFGRLAAFIKERTGHDVGFREVTVNALRLAQYELGSGKTLSVNVVCSKNLMEEFAQSSQARRKRFGNIVSNMPHMQTPEGRMSRFQISLDEIRGPKQYDIQYIKSESGHVWPVGIIGFYGSNINGWSERVGLEQTRNPHSIPSTHYMSSERAADYVFIVNTVANRFL
uniref:Uncharacterized protein n=1 Tax=Serratia phage Kevin TaxID=3161161 RepID=A0AAU8L076_9CAUD